MQAEAIEKLQHVSPNTPGNFSRPYRDQRFFVMWCPFHDGRLVGLLVYEPWPGEFWVEYCAEGCPEVGRSIEGLLIRRQPKVKIYVTARGIIVYESRRVFRSGGDD